mmetsp:Transcript_43057/g.71578  ORF Transcript_43057/g.71578 Transcript_43057/m.71578 type:complete len:312 (+) Transcript_43057:36-971(+)|eukprot:CAMPEP_0119331464 /NCGR_PEP_ID=MMETSP1333-20130426/80675_1 /TAXON_ID=418940 /ORGANISM="Scyphosphaera apsteinii, Strain RCC1455" /LENGTH=311 /DNA_ID=CAMNT_0007341077 /DNA_START=36 /DNA_END=971 /DNA_ORIENTATION=+
MQGVARAPASVDDDSFMIRLAAAEVRDTMPTLRTPVKTIDPGRADCYLALFGTLTAAELVAAAAMYFDLESTNGWLAEADFVTLIWNVVGGRRSFESVEAKVHAAFKCLDIHGRGELHFGEFVRAQRMGMCRIFRDADFHDAAERMPAFIASHSPPPFLKHNRAQSHSAKACLSLRQLCAATIFYFWEYDASVNSMLNCDEFERLVSTVADATNSPSDFVEAMKLAFSVHSAEDGRLDMAEFLRLQQKLLRGSKKKIQRRRSSPELGRHSCGFAIASLRGETAWDDLEPMPFGLANYSDETHGTGVNIGHR